MADITPMITAANTTVMVVNLHFQFAKKEPVDIALTIEGKVKHGDTVWLNDKQRRQIRESYRKVFHRPIEGRVFTFHVGKARPEGNLDHAARDPLGPGQFRSFNYESRERYRIVIPPGPKKHLWTNGRRARIFRHRGPQDRLGLFRLRWRR